MASFYSLPSSVLDSHEHKTLNAAYLFYYATDAAFVDRGATSTASGSASATHKTVEASTPPMSQEDKQLPAWKTSLMTSLSADELKDEEGVIRWEDEDAEVKSRLTSRLKALIGDLMVIAKEVSQYIQRAICFGGQRFYGQTNVECLRIRPSSYAQIANLSRSGALLPRTSLTCSIR